MSQGVMSHVTLRKACDVTHWPLSTRKISHAETTTQTTYDALLVEIPGDQGRERVGRRPGLDKLMKAVSRREIDMLMAWSVDRLGRSLQGLLDVLTELRAKRVDLYLHVQGVDT
jgi:DNA invertase Pin-like site-specific DNA recombinase